MTKEILFIDDELFMAQPYFHALNSEPEFRVTWIREARDAVDTIKSNETIAGAVLDVMMPAPKGVDPKIVSDGLTTGIWVAREVREIVIGRPLPILLLTHRDPEGLRDDITNLNLSTELCEVCKKNETPPFMIAQHLKRMIG